MIERLVYGEVPRKHHTQLKGANGRLRYEECITKDGFESAYTIAYHMHRPHEQRIIAVKHGFELPQLAAQTNLAKRHFLSQNLTRRKGPSVDSRLPMLFNDDVVLGVAFPDQDDPLYFADGDSDTLLFIFEGGGTLRTMLGDVPFKKDDYVLIPRGIMHRFLLNEGQQYWLTMELKGGFHIPKQFRTQTGQLRMDAPFCHRDFVRPHFEGPRDEGIREILIKRRNRFSAYSMPNNPFDLVGWDGAVWPFAFSILDFQPRVSSVHVPPTWHGTFAGRGALVCSFVPRVVDFAPDAIPCPYPHSSVDVDEFIFYVRGNFTSRRGVGPGSMSFHPAGIPHGPHPGSYERSIGTKTTDELAVMLDCEKPLDPTSIAASVEDPNYQESFIE